VRVRAAPHTCRWMVWAKLAMTSEAEGMMRFRVLRSTTRALRCSSPVPVWKGPSSFSRMAPRRPVWVAMVVRGGDAAMEQASS
jgi:hypothetical protein